ncbi:MAG: hypothetical protein CSA15_07215 [Candidatus Delongbacteria bacterium]|nr:MAG: hypothetical protein CSA15_07215 [Candidatus Delongbacteria bacterium]
MRRPILSIDIDSFNIYEYENGVYTEKKRETTAFKFYLNSLLDRDQLLKLSNFLNEFLLDLNGKSIDLEISDEYCYRFNLPYIVNDSEQIAWEIDKRLNDGVENYIYSCVENGVSTSVAVVRKEVKDIFFNILKSLNFKLNPEEIICREGLHTHIFNRYPEPIESVKNGSDNRNKKNIIIGSLFTILLFSLVIFIFRDNIFLDENSISNEDTNVNSRITVVSDSVKAKDKALVERNDLKKDIPKEEKKAVFKQFSAKDFILNFSNYSSIIVFKDRIIVYPLNIENEIVKLNEYNKEFVELDNSIEIPISLKTNSNKNFKYSKQFTSIISDELENYLNLLFESGADFSKLVIVKRNNKIYVKLF